MPSIQFRGASKLVLLAVVAATASCGLPRTGPTKSEIFAGSVEKQGDAFVVTVNDRVTRATSVVPSYGFGAGFEKQAVLASDLIAPGDLLSITVFENVKDDPLLGNTGQRVTPLTDVQVDGEGFIFVPYAGRLKAAGMTPEALRDLITSKLDPQTPDPQISVTRAAGDGSTVSVSGSVAGQGVFPIERPTRTLMAMLAKAGGVTIEPQAALVTVTRNGKTGKVWLQDLYDNPKLDIALRPGDRIVVERDRRSFVALGATGSQSRVPFDTQTVSAIEALAQVGGLSTALADPTGIFVFRNEPQEIANAVLGRNDLRGTQRFAYVLNLTEPNGVFLARDFVIRDGDTIYVTEAPFVQWTKTLAAFNGTATAVDSTANLAGGP